MSEFVNPNLENNEPEDCFDQVTAHLQERLYSMMGLERKQVFKAMDQAAARLAEICNIETAMTTDEQGALFLIPLDYGAYTEEAAQLIDNLMFLSNGFLLRKDDLFGHDMMMEFRLYQENP